MITVKIKPLYLPSNNNGKKVGAVIANGVTKKIADHMQSKIGNGKCDDHPEFANIVTLIVKDGQNPVIEKTSFCCEKFKNAVSLEFT